MRVYIYMCVYIYIYIYIYIYVSITTVVLFYFQNDAFKDELHKYQNNILFRRPKACFISRIIYLTR